LPNGPFGEIWRDGPFFLKMVKGLDNSKGDVMKTILITGCSSGYGLESARYFLSRDWNVIATMRTPREGALPRALSLRILSLDVTDGKSIAAAIKEAGPIDVLVNNAGVASSGLSKRHPCRTFARSSRPTPSALWR
jgi:NADP-dependent 3-hydroxy acid dehydrogenase YdfG